MVFEGEDTEKTIFDNLKKYFLTEKENYIIYGFHCGTIYNLYNKLQKNNETLFFVLKETLGAKNPELQEIEDIDIDSIFLFFDYDGHDTTAEYRKLESMVNFFNDEFENGKLYVSYPMVEALKHLKDDIDFKDIVAQSHRSYKQLVSENCDNNLLNLQVLTKDNWNKIIDEHCKKANFIVNNDFIFPEDIIKEVQILEKQNEKYIIIDKKVAVLSSFPIMLLDYYGSERLKEKILES